MGGFTALNLVLDHPDRFRSAVVGSCGYGADTDPETFKAEMEALADVYVEHGSVHVADLTRSEEHTSELQSLMRISYAVFCLKKKTPKHKIQIVRHTQIHVE